MSEGSFARSHLEKYGWEKGKGLGRTETGITDAIKPKLKFDTAGIGHDAGEQFSFHWWDHVFNKAAKNIQVENDEDGVKVRQKGTKANLITNKRTTHDNKTKSLLYGSFVKHGTLNPDGAISQDKELSSSSSSSDESDDDKPPDTYEGNDEMLFKACGGRTAHKGARHGLHLSGKLQRIEEQENRHSNNMKMQKGTKDASPDDEGEREENGQIMEKGKKRKGKKRKEKNRTKERNESREAVDTVESTQATDRIHVQGKELPDNNDLTQKPSKKKKKSKNMDETRNSETMRDIQLDSIDSIEGEGLSENSISPEIQLKEEDDSIDATRYRKKKSKKEKKNKKSTSKEINSEELGKGEIQEDGLSADEPTRKKKSKKEKRRVETDGNAVHHVEEEIHECKEQKDCARKRKKERIATDECIDNDIGYELENIEELKPKKKKDKRKNEKRHIKEEENYVTGVSSSQNGGDTISSSGPKKKRKRKSDKGLY